MKHDALEMALLYDYYGELLTERQKICFDLYYNQDLSLSEIAEDLGVTRQGVHDTIGRAEAQLIAFEEKTGSIARDRRIRQAAATIESSARALLAEPAAAEQARQILAALQEIKE